MGRSKLFRLLFLIPLALSACSGSNDGAGPSATPSPTPSPGAGNPGGGNPAVAEYCGTPGGAEDGLCQFVLIEQRRDEDIVIQMDYDEQARVLRRTEDRPAESFSEENRTYFVVGEYFVRNLFLPNNAIPDAILTTTIVRDDYGRIYQKVETEEHFDEMAGDAAQKKVSAYDNSIPGSALIETALFETLGGTTEMLGRQNIQETYDGSGNLIRYEELREDVDAGSGSTFAYLERSIIRNVDGQVSLESRTSYSCDTNPNCPGPGFANIVGDPRVQRLVATFDDAGLKLQVQTESYDSVENDWTVDRTCTYEHDENGNEIVEDCDGRRTESVWERLYDHLGLEPPTS